MPNSKICGSFLLLLIAAAVSCTNSPPAPGVSIPPDLARMIPAGTRILAGVDMKSLRAAPFYAQHPQLDALAEGIGLNTHPDASMLLVAWNSRQPVILTEPPVSSEKPAQGGLNGQLKHQLGELRKQDQIWVVSPNGLPLIEMPKRTDIASALSNITGYVTATSSGLMVDTGLHLRADVSCISDAGATRVRDAFRGGLAFARLITKDPDLTKLYEAVHVEQIQSDVILQADLSPELSSTLLKYLPEVQGTTATGSSRRLR